MADHRLTPEVSTRAGLVATYNSGLVASPDTYRFVNNGRTKIHVKKSGAGACTVTIPLASTVDGQAPASKTVSIPASTGDKFIGPFPKAYYNDAGGDVSGITFSEVTGLTIAVITD